MARQLVMKRGAAGFTLIELLAVIVIVSLLLGLSIALLRGAGKDLGVDASANQVASQLRAAHQLARSGSTPAWVAFDLRQNTVSMLLRETVGEWHFEDPNTRGAFGRDCQIQGGTPVPGRVGQGVRLSGSGSIRCMEVPVFAPDQGLAIEFWFNRRAGRGRGILATIGTAVEIAAETDGSFSAKVGALALTSGTLRLPVDTWCYVQLVYSGRDARLILNRNVVAVRPGRADWVAAGQWLVLGDSRSGPTGILDEARFSLVLPRDTFTLPAEASFEFSGLGVTQTEVLIGFDSEGRLDPPQEISLAVKSSALKRTITVGLSGNVNLASQ